MTSRARYVIIGTIALAMVAAMALSHGFQWAFIRFDIDDPYLFGMRDLSLSTLLGYGIAVAAATFVFKHGPTYTLANEVVDELSKVTWPTREETGNATVVVIVTVLISSVYLGAFDAVWLYLTDLLLGIDPLQAG